MKLVFTVCKMRKYHQLFLCVVTVISLSTLFVYRHEYLKLRYVLEVFNYFGTQQGVVGDDCLVLNETFMEKERTKLTFSRPNPTWTKFGQHFIYSSFWENEGERIHARTLAVGPPSAFINYECHIWLEHGDYLSSVMGKFGYSLRNIPKYFNDSKEHQVINMYDLFCEPIESLSQGLPHGLLLIYKQDSVYFKTFTPIYRSLIVDKKNLSNIAVCVRADVTGASKSSIIEFVSYHQSVGVTDFIFYDNGLQYNMLSIIKSLSGTKGFTHSVSILNWNFPFHNLDSENTAMEIDCLSRTSGAVKLVAFLNLDEYIIPKLQPTIKDLFEKNSSSKNIPVRFELETFICCTDLKDDKNAEKNWPIALRKTKMMNIKVRQQMIITYPLVNIEPSHHKLSPSSGVIHMYRPCTGLKTVTKTDPIMAKYLGNFMTSKLIHMWKSGSLLKESLKI